MFSTIRDFVLQVINNMDNLCLFVIIFVYFMHSMVTILVKMFPGLITNSTWARICIWLIKASTLAF